MIDTSIVAHRISNAPNQWMSYLILNLFSCLKEIKIFSNFSQFGFFQPSASEFCYGYSADAVASLVASEIYNVRHRNRLEKINSLSKTLTFLGID